MKLNKLLLGIGLFIGFVVLGAFLYIFVLDKNPFMRKQATQKPADNQVTKQVEPTKSVTQPPPPTRKPNEDLVTGDIGYVEPVHTVEIGTEKVSSGNFEKVEEGEIYFESNGAIKKLPLTPDRVAIFCTTQTLEGATQADSKLATSVNRSTPAELSSQIPEDELILVFADDVNGVLRAHTIVMASSTCVDMNIE